MQNNFIFFKYQGANLQCAGWIFFSVKRTSRPQRICSCASQLFTDVLLFLGNGTIFREKNIQRYFYAVSWLQDMWFKKENIKTPHNIYPINSTVVSHVVYALILCESSKAGSPITILSVSHDIVSRQRHRIWEKKTKRRIVIKMGFMQVPRVLSFDHHQELNQLHE